MRKFSISLGHVQVTIFLLLFLSLLIDFMLAAFEMRLGGWLCPVLAYFCWFLPKKIIKNPTDEDDSDPNQEKDKH